MSKIGLFFLGMFWAVWGISAQTEDFYYVPCPFEIPDGEVEGETLDCVVVIVPESRIGLSDRTIELAMVIVYPPGESMLDPLIYLAGGPGNSGTVAAAGFLDHPMRDVMPLIFLDQRGTGYSRPSLDCWEEDYEACYDRLVDSGVTIDAYRSSENAADVNDIIEAMELESVNIYGISYGTRLALTVMKDPHPAIRAVILDGVYPPNVQGYEDDIINIIRVFDAVFAGCARDVICDGTFPDLETVFYTMVEDLDNDPLILTDADGEEFELTGSILYDQLFQGLYSSDFIPYVPAIIYAASGRDGDSLSELLSDEDEELRLPVSRNLMGDVPENDGNSEGMFMSVDCADEAPFNTVDGIISAIETLGLPSDWFDDTVEEMVGILSQCDVWDVSPSDESIREATYSDIPSLLFNGEYDPVTPPGWGEVAAETLSNSYMYFIPAGGHGVLSLSECTLDITYQFLLEPYDEPDASCIDEMPSVAWYVESP